MTWTPGNWPHDGEPTVLVPMEECDCEVDDDTEQPQPKQSSSESR